MAKKIKENTQVNEPVESVTQGTEPLQEINEFLNGYTEQVGIDPIPEEPVNTGKRKYKKRGTQQQPNTFDEQQKIDDNALISGSLFVLLIDLALPNLIALANNKLSKKKIKASKLQMTPSQRADLEPLADAVAKQMMLKANPMTVFIISLLGIYGINFMMLKNE